MACNVACPDINDVTVASVMSNEKKENSPSARLPRGGLPKYGASAHRDDF